MVPQSVQAIRKLLHLSRKDIKQGGRCILLGADGALLLIKDMMIGIPIQGVEFSEKEDEVARIDGIPVVMRFDAPPGMAIITRPKDFPKQRCCDRVCMSSLLLVLSRGNA